MTVLVSSHLLAEIEQVADHLVLIRGGRVAFQGPVEAAPSAAARPPAAHRARRRVGRPRRRHRRRDRPARHALPRRPERAPRPGRRRRARPGRPTTPPRWRSPPSSTGAPTPPAWCSPGSSWRRPTLEEAFLELTGPASGDVRLPARRPPLTSAPETPVYGTFLPCGPSSAAPPCCSASTAASPPSAFSSLRSSSPAPASQRGARAAFGPTQGVAFSQLAGSGGLLTGMTSAVNLLGVLALSVAAGTMAGDHANGTLRNLLIRQPRRLRLLGGSWAALVSFALGAVLVSAVVAGGVALALAGREGTDSSVWFTAPGWTATAKALAETAGAVAGYATLGAALGVLLRAPVAQSRSASHGYCRSRPSSPAPSAARTGACRGSCSRPSRTAGRRRSRSAPPASRWSATCCSRRRRRPRPSCGATSPPEPRRRAGWRS